MPATAFIPELPFKLELPFEVFEKAGESGKERRVAGIISSEHKDRQGETVLQRGLDFSDFLSNGWINDNHSQATTGVVGYPIRVERTLHKGKPATRFEGYLLQTKDADKIWELASALQKTDRRLGFSIEGKVIRRADGGRTIAQARVTNVAVTNCPVNTMTGLDILAKSMLAIEGNQEAVAVLKALTAGTSVNDPGTTPGEGFALRSESVEKDVSDLAGKKKKKKKRLIAKSEALRFIRLRMPGLNDTSATQVLRWATGASK
jgi:Herelleviridae head maturation protease